MAGASRAREQNKRSHKDRKEASKEEESPTPRNALTSFFTRRHHQAAAVEEGQQKKCKRIGCSGSLCKLKENPKVSQRPETATSSKSYNKRSSMSVSSRSIKAPLRDMNGVQRRGSLRAIHLGRLSGCYECQMVVDPINGVFRNTSLRSTLCSCQDCGESFLKAESLELHKALRHAVSELDPEDSSRNIVKIIFQSSWLKKQPPACTIDRLLKIHNSDKTIARFESYRDSVKRKAGVLAKKHPRCVADGNELLRFHCASIACSLGERSTSLCGAIPGCEVCSIIRNGVSGDAQGRIRTMATSGRAHDMTGFSSENEKRAMLLCRVIAGRVRRREESAGEFDSVTGTPVVYPGMDDLFVFATEAILPCFMVVYTAL